MPVQDYAPPSYDYRKLPLGSLPGESGLQAAYNQGDKTVLVRVRNLSATRKRRVVDEYVSGRRGGNIQILKDKNHEKFGLTSVDQLRQRAADGENMNLESDRIEPVDFVIRHNNVKWTVPALDKNGEPAPWIDVAPGVWDLYMGNYERMNSLDRRERIDEISLLSGRNLFKFALSPDGEERPYAFLEFERREITHESVEVDAEQVRSGRIIEV